MSPLLILNPLVVRNRMLLNILLSSLLFITKEPEVIKPIEIKPDDVSPSQIGLAIVEFVIDKSGEVGEVNVIDTFDLKIIPLLEEAVRRMEFKPGMQNGVPVEVRYRLPIEFK